MLNYKDRFRIVVRAALTKKREKEVVRALCIFNAKALYAP